MLDQMQFVHLLICCQFLLLIRHLYYPKMLYILRFHITYYVPIIFYYTAAALKTNWGRHQTIFAISMAMAQL